MAPGNKKPGWNAPVGLIRSNIGLSRCDHPATRIIPTQMKILARIKELFKAIDRLADETNLFFIRWIAGS